ncbi:MAG TPA: metal-dependent phosphohydrolase [Candidatus Saccharimonadia bacterium]|nr:metal-dependent phosphohydrolase [Candidatus Saccharimonadia bacterium]
MFNPTEVLIDAFVERIQQEYRRMYGVLEPSYPGIIAWAGRMALENIANSDALYHDVEHTLMVTLVGQEILRGKHVREGGVSPRDWMHFMLSLLCHDIGYVRGVCREDRHGVYTTGVDDQTVQVSPGASDAALTPYHVDRGKRFVHERFGAQGALIDGTVIAANIERTRFPVPHDNDHQSTDDYPGLLRAADLIGQLASPNHMRKFPALFYEFEETGINAALGYKNPGDLRANYPTFFWKVVTPYIQDGLRYLRGTETGKQWIANLYAHVFAMEHDAPWHL